MLKIAKGNKARESEISAKQPLWERFNEKAYQNMPRTKIVDER